MKFSFSFRFYFFKNEYFIYCEMRCKISNLNPDFWLIQTAIKLCNTTGIYLYVEFKKKRGKKRETTQKSINCI